MPSRKITIQLIGDSDSLERAFSRSERKGKSFGNAMGLSAGSLKGFAKAGAAGAAVGGLALITKGLTSSISAAKDAEVVQAKLQTAVRNAGLSWDENKAHIDKAITAHSKLSGLDDEELSESFSNMLRSTKNVNKALQLNAIAANIARTKGQSLATAQSLVARVYLGSFMGLKRLGVAFKATTAAQDALKRKENALRDEMKGTTGARREALEAQLEMIKADKEAAKSIDQVSTRTRAITALQKNFAGQAEAYGKTAQGAQDKLSVAFENAQEKIGKKLLPMQTKLLLAGVQFIEWAERNWPKFSKAVSEMWAKVKPVFEAFRAYFDGWVKIIQGIIQGDWSLAWAGVKKAVVAGLKLVYEFLKLVPLNLFKFGVKMGQALADGVIAGIGNLVDRIMDKIPGLGDTGEPSWLKKAIADARASRTGATSTTAGPPTRTPPGRARGGPVLAGRQYRVGESGMEILTMGRTSGYVTPNAGAATVVVPVYLDGREIARVVAPHLQRNGKSVGSQTRGRLGGNPLAAFG